MITNDDWRCFAVGLARALGAVHAAVGLTVLTGGTLPMIVAIAAGSAALFLTGRVRRLTPGQTGALGYAGPVLAVVLIRVTLVNPADYDALQHELLRFLWTVWRNTPVPAYCLAILFGLSAAKTAVPHDPFARPR